MQEQEIEKLKKLIKSKMGEKRYIHTLNVADESIKLAKRYNVDSEKAYLAGLLHDICKEVPQVEQYEYVFKSNMDVSYVEKVVYKLWHGIAGAYYVKNELHIDDEDILNAIRYHTTGRAGMSRLEEIVYVADLVSAERDYDGVEEVRILAYKGLDEVMLFALKYSMNEVMKKSSMIPINTLEAYNQYVECEMSRKSGGNQ